MIFKTQNSLLSWYDIHLIVWGISLITFITGFLTLARPIAERLPSGLSNAFFPISTENRSLLLTVFGISLIFLSYELLQRKQVAWWSAVVLVAASLFLHLHIRPQLLQTIISGIAIATLLVSRGQFHSKIHSDNIWQGLRMLGVSLSLALVYGTIGFWLLTKNDFGVVFSLSQSFVRTLRSYLLIGNSDITPHTIFSRWFLHSLAIVGGISLIYAVFGLFRPLQYRLRSIPNERKRVKALLEKYGGETDDFFKLWPKDKSFFFSNDNQASIAYGVARGVALAFGAPVGRPDSIEMAIGEFKELCLQNGWLPVFAQASDKYRKQFLSKGFNNLIIGADAVIDTDQFIKNTSRNKYFRNIYNRFINNGYFAERKLPPHSNDLISQAKQVSNDWLKRPGRKQWRFFTGYFSSQYLDQTPLFGVRDSKKRMIAFANELPDYKAGETTIDLMRQLNNAPPNVMDFLFMELIKKMNELGYKKFNLGLSPLAAKNFADSPSDKLLSYVYGSNNPIISFRGLHRYKAKFEPEWEPRYLYYAGTPARFPQISLAIAKLIKY